MSMTQEQINVGLFDEVKKLRGELDAAKTEITGLSQIAGIYERENIKLRDWIREQGQHTDTCTYHILGKEICQYCQCGRANDILSNNT